MLKKNQRLVAAMYEYKKNNLLSLEELAKKHDILLQDLLNRIEEYKNKQKIFDKAAEDYEKDESSTIESIAKKYGFYHKELSDAFRKIGVFIRTTVPTDRYNPKEYTREKCIKVLDEWRKNPNVSMGTICKKYQLTPCLFKAFCDVNKIRLKLIITETTDFLKRRKKDRQYRLDITQFEENKEKIQTNAYT